MADLSPEPPAESKLAQALRRALLNTGAVSDTKVSHLCQEVRQIIADELRRNQPERAPDKPISKMDQRGWDQSIGFDNGWDAARSAVLMPVPPLMD